MLIEIRKISLHTDNLTSNNLDSYDSNQKITASSSIPHPRPRSRPFPKRGTRDKLASR